MTAREQLIDKMARAIYGSLDPDFEGWEPGPEYFEAADAALRVLEQPLPTMGGEIKPCTCGHNGYGSHKLGCELY